MNQSKLTRWLILLMRHPFWVVLGGTGAAQLIGFISAPLLTRLYSPEAFGLLAVFTAALSVAGSIAGGRYEQAIVSQTNRHDAGQIVVLVSLCALLCAILGAILLPCLRLDPSLAPVIVYVIPGMCLYVVGVAISNWLIREGCFSITSGIKVAQALGGLLVSLILFGSYDGLVKGIIFGYVVAALGATFIALRQGLLSDGIKPKEIAVLAKKYRSFPVFGVLPAICDSFATLIPIYFIAFQFNQADVGQFGLVRQVIAGPLGMISSAISVLLTKRLADAVLRKDDLIRLLRQFSTLALGPLLLVGVIFSIFGPHIFKLIFGANWLQSGILSQWTVWAYVAMAFASPLSAALVVLRKIWLNGIWQVIHFGCLCFLLLVEFNSIEQFVRMLVVTEVVSYILYACLSFFAVRSHQSRNVESFFI